MIPRPTANRGHEHGAVIVELALVAIPLVVLLLGMIELALMWKADTQVSAATRQGARVASHLGDDPLTDQAAVKAVVAAMGGAAQVEQVIIFDAAYPDLATTCTGASHQRCNLYTSVEFALLDDGSRWGCGTGSLDANWCPSIERDTAISSRTTVGVAASHQHPMMTNFFGSDARTLTGSTVMALEPND